MRNSFEIGLGGEKLRLRMDENLYQFKHTWDVKRHSNADFELHIILRGGCSMDVDHDKFIIHDRQAILIAPGRYHLPAPIPGEFERFSVSFSLPEGVLMNTLRTAVPISRIYSVGPEIVSTCRDIFHESAAGNLFRRDMLHLLLAKLMICNFRLLGLPDNEKMGLSPISDVERINLIDSYFEMHLADEASAEALAAELHLSRRQLARVLQQNYGMGFREKLIRTRMDHAAWMLRRTDKRVTEIAVDVGYDSEAAFYQVFRTRFSMTPTQYRIMFKSEKSDANQK